QTWEDTHATVDADVLVAHANKLSAFAVGLVEHPSPNTTSVGFLDRFVLKMPQLGQSVDVVSSPTETALAPTAMAVGTAEPVPETAAPAQPGMPLPAAIASMIPVLVPIGLDPTPTASPLPTFASDST